MSVVGGEQIEVQGAALREGCHVVVATPGRLKDCLERRYAVLQQVFCFCLVLSLSRSFSLFCSVVLVQLSGAR